MHACSERSVGRGDPGGHRCRTQPLRFAARHAGVSRALSPSLPRSPSFSLPLPPSLSLSLPSLPSLPFLTRSARLGGKQEQLGASGAVEAVVALINKSPAAAWVTTEALVEALSCLANLTEASEQNRSRALAAACVRQVVVNMGGKEPEE